MSDLKDPAIKLFGRTISFSEAEDGSNPAPPPEPVEVEKIMSAETKDTQLNDVKPDAQQQVDHTGTGSSCCMDIGNEDENLTSTEDEKIESVSKAEQVHAEDDRSAQEKILKRPDKILPCPRCNSMDTKFCYYNNYNVNQPRHFCKKCQRYWTAGGTMRNVPVGAGRRKNKHSTSQYRHIMMSSNGLAAGQADVPNLMHHQALPCGPSVPMRPMQGNGAVLKFGLEVPLCETIDSVLNIGEQKNTDFGSTTFSENKECVSSVTASNCTDKGLPENAVHNLQNGMQGYCNGFTPLPHLQYYPRSPLMCPWSLGWNNIAAMEAGTCSSDLVHGSENGKPSTIVWTAPQVMAIPGISAPSTPFPFVPASFWGCLSTWPNGMWNVPWIVSPSSSTSNSGCLGNGSLNLGKHSRDSSLQVDEKVEKSLWVPKTLRIDDPDEAAKSSIWATLGIKPDEKSVFKPFQSKAENKSKTSDAAQVLHANPAALSRFQSFQEST